MALALEGAPAHLIVPVRGQDDRGSTEPAAARCVRRSRPLILWHPQIDDQAAGVRPMHGLEEGLRGDEGLDPKADRRQQVPDRSAE